jgi:methyl-accepting chemotaxis protein
MAQNTAINSARENALQSAQKTAYQVKAELEVGMDASRTVADAFSGIKDKDNPLQINRDQANIMLRKVLENNPLFLVISTGWEPNAFDGKDAIMSTQRRTMPPGDLSLWVRDSKGAISHVALVIMKKKARVNTTCARSVQAKNVFLTHTL